jgi:GT2 family glycosyltransferase
MPRWSVIVPTYNRPRQLAGCVRALAALRPPAGGFEIIVVNDGGVEAAAEVRAAARGGNALAAHFITRTNGGPGAARNTGAAAANGTFLAFTDDDCVPVTDWLPTFDGALTGREDALAGGPVVNALHDDLYAEASQRLVAFVTSWFDGAERERFFTSNNIAVARAAFLEAGGFDESFRVTGEDREFCDRWAARGRPAVAVDDAIVHHAHALSMTSFVRQHYGYGAGAARFRHVRRQGGRPVRIEPRFYTASLRHAARGQPARRALALAGLTGVAHAAYLGGLLRALLRGRSSAPEETT